MSSDIFTTEEQPDIKEQGEYVEASAKYALRMPNGEYGIFNERQTKRQLALRGVSGTKAEGEVCSPLDQLLTFWETYRAVSYAGPMGGYQAGVHQMNGQRVLITRSTRLMPPAAGPSTPEDFPLIHGFLSGLLNGEEVVEETGAVETIEQLPYFLAWLAHFLQSLHAEIYSTGLFLALAGQPESGKTLCAHLIAAITGESIAKPYRYLIGQDNFNAEITGATLLVVDDENSDTHIGSRLKFGAEMKQIVASGSTRVRGMHQNALLVKPIQRLLACVNIEPERLQVLPPIDNDLADKVLLLKAYARPMPMPARSPAEREALWGAFMREAPHFVRFLLDYQIPEAMRGRFGVVAYQHPLVVKDLAALSPEARTLEHIQRFFLRRLPRIYPRDLDRLAARDRGRLGTVPQEGVPGFIGSVADLRGALLADGENAVLSSFEKREVRASAYLGRDLVALARKYQGLIWYSATPGSNERVYVMKSDGVLFR